jgi:hypothetical protein
MCSDGVTVDTLHRLRSRGKSVSSKDGSSFRPEFTSIQLKENYDHQSECDNDSLNAKREPEAILSPPRLLKVSNGEAANNCF